MLFWTKFQSLSQLPLTSRVQTAILLGALASGVLVSLAVGEVSAADVRNEAPVSRLRGAAQHLSEGNAPNGRAFSPNGFKGGGMGGQRHGGGPGGPGEAHGPKGHGDNGSPVGLLRQLNLSEEQKTKVQEIIKQGQADSKALRDKNKGRYREMMDYMASPVATESKAMDLQRQIQQEQAQLSEMRIKSWFKIRQVLTKEQLEQINSRFQEHRDRMEAFRNQNHRGPGPSGGPGGRLGGAFSDGNVSGKGRFDGLPPRHDGPLHEGPPHDGEGFGGPPPEDFPPQD